MVQGARWYVVVGSFLLLYLVCGLIAGLATFLLRKVFRYEHERYAAFGPALLSLSLFAFGGVILVGSQIRDAVVRHPIVGVLLLSFTTIAVSLCAYLMKKLALLYYAITAVIIGIGSVIVATLKLTDPKQDAWIALIGVIAGAYALAKGLDDFTKSIAEFSNKRLPLWMAWLIDPS